MVHGRPGVILQICSNAFGFTPLPHYTVTAHTILYMVGKVFVLSANRALVDIRVN